MKKPSSSSSSSSLAILFLLSCVRIYNAYRITPQAINFFQAQKKPTQTVSLGGLQASPIGVGTWAWGNQFLWGYSSKSDAELQQTFDYVLSKGVNWFDTADSYGTGNLEGQSEKLLGKFIREHDYKSAGGVKRPEDVLIATKIAPYPFRIGKESIKKAMKESQKRLNREYVDIGQLHWPPPLGWQEKAYLQGLAELYGEGEIRAIGVSNYGPKKLQQASDVLKTNGASLASNQVQFSLVSSLPLKSGLVETAEGLGVRLIAYSPLGLGILTGKYTEDRLPKGPRGLLFKELLPEIRSVLSAMEEIVRDRARKGGSNRQQQPVSYSQVALNWCRAKGSIPIVGLKTISQAKEAMAALDWQLNPSEVEALDQAVAKVKKGTVQNIFQTD